MKSNGLNFFGKGLMSIILAGEIFLNLECDNKNNSPVEKYAFFMNGLGKYYHESNLALAYQMLSKKGFPKRNIYILDREGEKSKSYPVYGKLTNKNIEKVFDILSEKIDLNDSFFLYITGEGGREAVYTPLEKINNYLGKILPLKKMPGKETSYIQLHFDKESPKRDFYSHELKKHLKNIRPKIGILIFD